MASLLIRTQVFEDLNESEVQHHADQQLSNTNQRRASDYYSGLCLYV